MQSKLKILTISTIMICSAIFLPTWVNADSTSVYDSDTNTTTTTNNDTGIVTTESGNTTGSSGNSSGSSGDSSNNSTTSGGAYSDGSFSDITTDDSGGDSGGGGFDGGIDPEMGNSGEANNANSRCDGKLPKGGPAAGSFESKDHTYKNLKLEADKEYKGTRTKEPIIHKKTEVFSALKELNPWYFVNLQGENGPYLGPIYRGNQNEHRHRHRITQISPLDTINTCKRVIEPINGSPNYYDPVWGRMEMDACANQYILSRARLPRVDFEDQGQPPFIRQEKGSMCQPLRLIPLKEDEQEYLPSDYIYYAWKKLLYDHEYLLREGNAPEEPNYKSHGVKVKYPIYPPTQGQKSFNVAGNKQTASKYNFGLTCVNDLTENQVERILDPSHPFSPRWDFEFNERDEYSWLTGSYSNDPKNYVRCGGGKDTNIIKTDVLSWRAKKFHENIMMRIITNVVCYEIIIYNQRICWEDLWSCDENDKGGQTAGQCCATNYDGEDAEDMRSAARTVCGAPLIEDLCADITKPLAPINTLKMRKNTKSNFLKDAPEGYTFEEYFQNHRPYMRCWDTGLECDLEPKGDSRHNNGRLTIEGLKDVSGSLYAIVGAGRERELCGIGGGAGLESVVNKGVKFKGSDPITSWAELKLYQARSTREFGLGCLAKHEVAFKPGQGEEIILSSAGGEYQKVVPDGSGNLTRPTSFSWPMSWRGYVSDTVSYQGFPNFGKKGSVGLSRGIDAALLGDILIYDRDVVRKGRAGTHRNPYVAYVTETNTEEEEDLHWIKVLAFNHGKFLDSCGNSDTWGQGEEFTIFKTDVTDEDNTEYEDYGYKSVLSAVTKASDGIYTAKKENNCDDPLISSCIEPYWDTVKRYFPAGDIRYRNKNNGSEEEESSGSSGLW